MEALKPIITLELPYPPSVNHYWRRVGARTLISREGRAYRSRVCAMLALRRVQPIEGRVDIRMIAHPPDRRRRDLDNLQKIIFDSLQDAGIYEDDSQIDHIDINRGHVVPGGKLIIHVAEVCANGTAPVPA